MPSLKCPLKKRFGGLEISSTSLLCLKSHVRGKLYPLKTPPSTARVNTILFKRVFEMLWVQRIGKYIERITQFLRFYVFQPLNK